MTYNIKDLKKGEKHEHWLQEFNGEMRKIMMRQPETMEGTFFVEMMKNGQPFILGTVKEDVNDNYYAKAAGRSWHDKTPRKAAEHLVDYMNKKDQERQRRFEEAQAAWKAKQNN